MNEQIETFRDVVQLLKKSAEKHATEPRDAKSFDAIVELIQRNSSKQGKPITGDRKANAF